MIGAQSVLNLVLENCLVFRTKTFDKVLKHVRSSLNSLSDILCFQYIQCFESQTADS